MWFRLLLALFLAVFAVGASAEEKTALKEKLPIEAGELCKGREGCRLMWTKPAGKDEKNRPMFISEVVVPSPSEWHCRRPPSDHNGEYVKDVRQEIWLSLKGVLLTENSKILDFCNDGYGAADVGEDKLDIEEGFLTHRAFGGSALRWMNGQRLRLPSLEVVESQQCSMHSLFGGNDFRTTEYDTGAMRIGWSAAVRGDGETPSRDDFINCEAKNVESANARYEAILFKQINSFLGLRLEEVKELGTCATILTTKEGPHQGYIIYGQDDGADAEIKALRVNDDQLWIAVTDKGRNFTASKDWSKDDRIEIWWVEERMPRAVAGPRRALRQFAVRLADLLVFPGYGYNESKKKLPFIERQSGEGFSFIVRWPAEQFPSAQGFTLAYARGDGKNTAVMWATSTFKYAEINTLGPVLNLQQAGTDPMQSCRLDKDGVLQLIRPEFERPKNP